MRRAFADGSHRIAGPRGRPPADRARDAGALPGARPAAARAGARARAAGDRRSGRSGVAGATRCAASTPSSTWPAARATSRARPSRSSTGWPPGGCCAPPSASGARHFVWITPLGATPHHPMRMQRAKALAAAALAEADDARPRRSPTRSIYAPGDRHLRWLERLGYLPAVPLVGRGIARTQPLWAEDAADCVLAALEQPAASGHVRYELAGPETLTQREVVRLVLAAARPPPAHAAAAAGGPARRAAGRGDARRARRRWSPGTRRSCWRWRCSARAGRADAEALGVTPAPDGGGSGRWCAHGCAASICARPGAAGPR